MQGLASWFDPRNKLLEVIARCKLQTFSTQNVRDDLCPFSSTNGVETAALTKGFSARLNVAVRVCLVVVLDGEILM